MPKLLCLVAACWLVFAAPVAAQSSGQTSTEDLDNSIFRLSEEAAQAYGRDDTEAVVDKVEELLPLIERRLGSDSVEYADLNYALAENLTKLGRYAEAERPHDLSVNAISAWYGKESSGALAALNGRANNLAQLGKLRQSEVLFLDLIAQFRDSPLEDGVAFANAIGNYAGLLDKLGRNDEAESFHREALQIKEREFGPAHEETMVRLNNLSANLSSQGRLQEAANIQLAVISRRDSMNDIPVGQRAQGLANYAAILDGQRKFEEAEAVHLEALELARQGNDPLDLAFALTAFGRNQAGLGNAEAAYEAGVEGYQIYQRLLGQDHSETLMAANNMALLDLAAGNPHQAALRLSYIMERLTENDLKETNFARTVMSNLSTAMLMHDEHSHQAHRNMQPLVNQLVERRRSLDRSADLRAANAANETERRDIFTLYAETQWARRVYETRGGGEDTTNATNLAFFGLQEAMIGPASRAIATRVANSLAAQKPEAAELSRLRGELSADLAMADASLSAELTNADGGDVARRNRLRAQSQRLKGRLGEVDAELKAVVPAYFDLLQPEPLGIEYARELLMPDEAILIIVPGLLATHAIAVSKEDVVWFRPQWGIKKIDQAARRLLWNVGANVAPNEEEFALWGDSNAAAFDRQTAHNLYLQIVAPAKRVLTGKKHVYISAAGSLSGLPFSMLVSAPPSGADDDPVALRATRWLGDDYALIQLPSLHSLKFLRDGLQVRRTSSKSSFLGFGDPVLNGRAASRGLARGQSQPAVTAASIFSKPLRRSGLRLADPEKLRELSRLPGTATELQAIWRAFGEPKDALFLGHAATEIAVKEAVIDTEVLVFATHGLLAGESSEIGEPGLVLTPPDQASVAEDGYLSSSEIAALRINADWVILSACNTAAGDGSRGASGLSGIARAFFYAGAQSLLASHWPVDDAVAAELTVDTISRLKAEGNLSRAEAFQQAMRAIRNNPKADKTATWAHPAAWAPFTLIGDGASR